MRLPATYHINSPDFHQHTLIDTFSRSGLLCAGIMILLSGCANIDNYANSNISSSPVTDARQQKAIYAEAKILADRGELTKSAEMLQPIYASYTPAKALYGSMREYVFEGSGELMLEDAISEYERQLAQGDQSAHIALAEIYANRTLPFVNEKVAFDHYTAAAANGNTEAYFPLAVMYYEGRIIPRDKSKAIQYYTLAAQEGNIRAYLPLFLAYCDGGWYEPDAEQAFSWLKRHVDHEYYHLDHAEHLAQLGMYYLLGSGTVADAAKAEDAFDAAAKEKPALLKDLAQTLYSLKVEHAARLAEKYRKLSD